jgi:plasmid stabilization system protein ParE
LKRYTLNRDAESDLDGIIHDLLGIPDRPALKIGKDLQAMLQQIAEWPQLGLEYKDFRGKYGYEVRSRLCGNYKIFYRADIPMPDIIAIIHMKRDIDSIMRERLGQTDH